MEIRDIHVGIGGEKIFVIAFESSEFDEKFLNRALELMAASYVGKFGNEVFAKIDQQAVANLAIARAAQAISESKIEPKKSV